MYWNGLRVIDRKRGAAPNRSTEENDQYTLFFSIHPTRSAGAAWKIVLITKVWTVKIIIENTVTGWCRVFVFDRPDPIGKCEEFLESAVRLKLVPIQNVGTPAKVFLWMKTYFHRRSNKPRVIFSQLMENWMKYFQHNICVNALQWYKH